MKTKRSLLGLAILTLILLAWYVFVLGGYKKSGSGIVVFDTTCERAGWILSPGGRVDVIAYAGTTGEARTILRDIPVEDVKPYDPITGSTRGGRVTVALKMSDADARVFRQAERIRLAVRLENRADRVSLTIDLPSLNCEKSNGIALFQPGMYADVCPEADSHLPFLRNLLVLQTDITTSAAEDKLLNFGRYQLEVRSDEAEQLAAALERGRLCLLMVYENGEPKRDAIWGR
jgi:hypothetical protein